MRRYNLIKLFGRYLHDHVRFILYLFAIVLTFGVVLSLYDITIEPLLYATMLSGAIGGVLLTADYIRYVHRYVTLDNLRKEILYSLENMPPCDNLIAQTYTELLETIQR